MDADPFDQKITERLAQIARERDAKQEAVEDSMRALDEQRRIFEDRAEQLMATDIFPRMQALAERFENARVRSGTGISNFHCICKFNHTTRFPTTTTLDISIAPEIGYGGLQVHYNLKILPILMQFKRHDQISVSVDSISEERLAAWIEDRLLEFLDTYLRIEQDPLYQKDNFVNDPVCGTPVLTHSAPEKIELDDEIFYFCSHACKEAFERVEPELDDTKRL